MKKLSITQKRLLDRVINEGTIRITTMRRNLQKIGDNRSQEFITATVLARRAYVTISKMDKYGHVNIKGSN
tara:strand:+ start:256 stop:468 length:213 start_codon:yes stop_codon:yes gene_type:complete